MKTTAIIATLLLTITSSGAFAETVCRTEGEASISSTGISLTAFSEKLSLTMVSDGPRDAFDWSDTFAKLGSELRTSTGVIEGNDIIFRGRPAVGGLVYGAYPDWDGSEVVAQARLEVSINWKPDAKEVCTKHKTVFGKGRKCVQKGLEDFPTSFVLDMTTDVGQHRYYIHSFQNVNQLSHGMIVTPQLRCLGPINKFEVRILDLNGGEVEFKVHKVEYTAFGKY